MEGIRGGLGSLASYLAAHVLLCLVPAFFIAGALAALLPKAAITRYLGRDASKAVAYPAAMAAGSLLAVCSCTIVPLFAGIYRKGAGLGPAVTFLFFAPAANILALTYTGAALGGEFAAARLVLSLGFGVGIGLTMAALFSVEDRARAGAPEGGFAAQERVQAASLALTLLLVALLLAGTLKLGVLLDGYASLTLPITGIDALEAALHRLVPFDPARGEEGIGAQGGLLVLLLLVIAAVAPRGLGRVDEGFNRWTWTALSLVGATLAVASIGLEPHPDGVTLHLTGKLFGVLAAMAAIAQVARRRIDRFEVQQWLWESWRFARQIVPLLVVGVVVVGVLRVFIRPEWGETMAGTNSVLANLVGVLFGVFMYFPTLVEVPVAKMFLSLGMHPGPLLAYLMADPELSLQSALVTATVIGWRKTVAYVGLVALFSMAAGLAFGAWKDGASLWLLGGALGALLLFLALTLHALGARMRRVATPA